jgi:hypothetical protein
VLGASFAPAGGARLPKLAPSLPSTVVSPALAQRTELAPLPLTSEMFRR